MSKIYENRIIVILAIAIAFGFIVLLPFRSKEKLIEDTLVIGLQSGYPPFEMLNADGVVVGFDIDVATLIAKKMGRTLVIKDMEFDGEILSLKQGKIDLIISGMNITPSRLKEIAMIPYHGELATSLSLIFWKEIPEGVQSIEDLSTLSNCAVSVESGSIPELYLNRYQNIQAKSFQGALGPLMDLKYGKSVANLVEPDVADYLKMQHPEIQILPVPLPEEEGILGFGIGVKKDNQKLLLQVQQIIYELKASGQLKQLEDKWFKGGRS